tara:strand:- start:1347 stop:1511 length:165 start_codon:yes stop_codon:yes gene_type:complete
MLMVYLLLIKISQFITDLLTRVIRYQNVENSAKRVNLKKGGGKDLIIKITIGDR